SLQSMHTRTIRQSIDNGWAEQGGYMRAKKSKLENQFRPEKETLQSNIFHGVSIYVNGYTDPPALELRDLIRAHGGQYRAYYSRSRVTHIIATRLPMGKVNKLTDQKIVSSAWIVESPPTTMTPTSNNKLMPHRPSSGATNRVALLAAYSKADKRKQATANTSLLSLSNTFSSPSPHPINNSLLVVDVENSRSSESPKGKTGRRLQQMRLDACLSPSKTSTGSVPHLKPTGAISLKQLLQGSVPSVPINTPNQKTVDSNSPENQTTHSPSQHPTDTDAQLATFYARSRLHHLSSWANELRDLVQQLRDDPAYCESGLGEEWKRSVILQSTNDPSVVVTLRASQIRSCTKHTPPQHRVYFHIDMDCFFVSVSLRNRPELKDKPVAITHASSSGDDKAPIHRRSGVHSMSEVASCSYTARQAGIRNGMLLGQARQLCPELITLPYDFEAYKEVSEVLYRTVSHFTLNIQAVSCDELYADCTDLLSLDNTGSGSNCHQANLSGQNACLTQRIVNPLLLGARLRSLVEERTGGCTASIGFGSSKLLARLATKKAKPNGQAWFLGISGDQNPGDCAWRWAIEGLNSSASETSLPTAGIGRVLVMRLATAFNVTTCGELMRSVARGQLIDLVGRKTGERLYWLCRGRDPCDQLHVQKPSKSVSACMNYGIRLQTLADMEKLVRSLTTELVSRMSNTKLTQDSSVRGGVRGQNLTVRVFIRAPNAPQESAKFMGHGICKKASRMISLPEATADPHIIQRFTMSVLRQLCPDVKDLRGLGLQMNRLSMSTVDRCVNKQLAKPSSNTLPPPTASTVNSASSPVIKEVLLKPAVVAESVISDAQASEVSHTPVRVRRRSLRLKRRSSSSG
ncbi:DNA repair protein REV1, partial [Clonorchis sinensis]